VRTCAQVTHCLARPIAVLPQALLTLESPSKGYPCSQEEPLLSWLAVTELDSLTLKRQQHTRRGTSGAHERESCPEPLRTTEISRTGQALCFAYQPRSRASQHKTRPTVRLSPAISVHHVVRGARSLRDRMRASAHFRQHLHMQDDVDFHAVLGSQALERTFRADDASKRAEDIARAQAHALLAVARAVDRLAKAIEERS
jgi:hypothetical protein